MKAFKKLSQISKDCISFVKFRFAFLLSLQDIASICMFSSNSNHVRHYGRSNRVVL